METETKEIAQAQHEMTDRDWWMKVACPKDGIEHVIA